ncbi:DUF6202 family protein [Streptomyces bacillaris]|uniref:DUF6202 family protein n=1 Tax=Streptomyces bacillaris TaxID=68179 RepID=UPI003467D314
MSTDRSALASDSAREARVTAIIREAGLCRPENRFFHDARTVESVTPAAALKVGRQWQAMTKAFMFTTVASLGLMARRFHHESAPDQEVLGAFQTAYLVIGDDLANLAPEFSAVSPKGVSGVHYVWWEDSILKPLTGEVSHADAAAAEQLPPGVQALLANMEQLADSPLGAAVQLRVVEAIALDIAVAFRRVYSKVRVNGDSPYTEDKTLSWIDSHIKAETVHAKSVSDDETGMTVIASTAQERADLLTLAEEYAGNWAMALNEFADALAEAPALVGSVR